MTAPQIVISLVAAVLLFWSVGAYNRLVGLRNVIGKAFAQVDAQIKRRHELMPLLAEAARPHAGLEADTLEAACAACRQARAALDLARARPCAFGAVSSLSLAEHVVDATRARLLDALQAAAGANADPALGELVAELNATDHKLAYARQVFNDAVDDYNQAARQFPTRLLSTLYGFREAAPLQATPPAPARNT